MKNVIYTLTLSNFEWIKPNDLDEFLTSFSYDDSELKRNWNIDLLKYITDENKSELFDEIEKIIDDLDLQLLHSYDYEVGYRIE